VISYRRFAVVMRMRRWRWSAEFELVEHLERSASMSVDWGTPLRGHGVDCLAELFIAAAAAPRQRIRLGTGVISLPYHHPLMVAIAWCSWTIRAAASDVRIRSGF